MKTNSKLAKVVSRLWPNGHGHYEEMSVLAVTGQLTGMQMCELNDHISTCDSCRNFLESVAQVSVQAMPLLADNRVPAADIVPPEDMRARFLSRVAAEKVNTKSDSVRRPYPVLMQKLLSVSPAKRFEGEELSSADGEPSGIRFSLFLPMWRPATILAACAVIGVTGFYVGKRIVRQTPEPVTQVRPSRAPISENAPTDGSDRASRLEQQKAVLEAQLVKLKGKLSLAETQQKVLGGKLAEANNKLTALVDQTQEERQRATQEAQQAKNHVTFLQREVERLRWLLEESKARLTARQHESEELKAKLDETESDLRRELDLKSARSEIGDLAAARNLHIVDVYDADNKGKRQRPFGRVFYTEGKSLVFYAYDLEDSRRLNANVVFHVWGEKAGMKETTHSLGILHNDDASHDRWAMTFDDPKVLAQINSVFVTAEAANKRYHEPHGKKVLYAYFGSRANHP